jgi:UDP-N-acetylglucosamine--N-acetylmuramyl-(pentapeptide) pyrophosphoryl-undecaprenol N-acetylglucosamine transferase
MEISPDALAEPVGINRKFKNMNKKCVVIAGGGTGGHIYPGIAIARAIQQQQPDFQVHFVGTAAGLENKIVPREGFPLHHINIGKLNHAGGFKSKIRTIFGMPKAFIQSIALLMELKPQAVLGVGGYASGPFVLVASLLGFRTAIWEPNAFPGMTNRWLSRFVGRSFVVFDEAAKFLRSNDVSQVGLPVRKEFESISSLSLVKPSKEFHVLVFGGSQGARPINSTVRDAVLKGGSWLDGVKIIHQTGPQDFASISQSYQGTPQVEVHEYLYQIEKNFEWADLIVCRAGASTVAEVAACGKPAIFIPLPTAADDHQRKNAESLLVHGAATMILQKDLTPDTLIAQISELKQNEKAREKMRENLVKFYKPQAAEKMAELLLG